jgi:uncharacterized protein (UPF0276 family)
VAVLISKSAFSESKALLVFFFEGWWGLLGMAFRNLGFGLGLRAEHYESILEDTDLIHQKQAIDFFEVITENYLVPGGKPLYYLDQIRARYPVVMHGVSLSIGSSDPLDLDYLAQVKALAGRIEPAWISDHLCWTGVAGKNAHDLLPLPYTQEAIDHVVSRLDQVQTVLGRPVLIENVSSYLNYQESTYSEWAFISEIMKRSGCFMLLDVNNVYVSSVNHDFDPMEYIGHIPTSAVCQIHLAGHSDCGDYVIDTHDQEIADVVWNLYAETIRHHGFISTVIERDDHIPPLAELLKELHYAKHIAAQIMPEVAA